MAGRRLYLAGFLAVLGVSGIMVGCQANSAGLRERFGFAALGQKQSATPTSSPQELEAQLQSAIAQERAGDLSQAIVSYKETVQRYPTCARAYHGLASCHGKTNDMKQADQYYQLALQHAPQDSEMLCDYAYFCYLGGNLPQAESLLRQALVHNPGMPRAHNNLGLVLARSGKEQEALRAFMRAGCAKPEAHVNLAYALMWDERFDQAEKQLKAALRADPSSQVAAQGLRQLQSRQLGKNPAEKIAMPSRPEERGATKLATHLQEEGAAKSSR